jgi:CubicO group peptidase (beta-lactamase class C family)
MTKKLLLLALIGILLSCNNTKKESKPIQKKSTLLAIEETADFMLKDATISSVSISVFQDGETYTEHYGELDKGKGNTPTDKTIYEIASVTKTFTGYLVAKAVIDKKIALEDDVRKYLKGSYPNLEYNGHPIKIKDVITHTARLPANIKKLEDILARNSVPNALIQDDIMIEIAKAFEDATRETFLNELHQVKIDTIPGLKYSYSNIGANLAGHILETVYEKDYSALLREHIFSKAGMNSSYSIHSDKAILANGYNDNGKIMPFLTLDNSFGAEGSIKSTTPDIINYIKFQLNKDKYVNESFSKQYNEENDWVGYFWGIEKNEDDIEYYRHHGAAFGSQNMLYIIPEYSLGIHIITNVTGQNTYKILDNAGEKLIKKLTKKKLKE